MAKLETTRCLLKSNKQITFRSIESGDAEAFLAFRKQIPQESNNTMQYIGINSDNWLYKYKNFKLLSHILLFNF